MKPLTRKEMLLDKIANSNLGVSGTKNITENGDYDVARFASAHVAVPAGTTPTGKITITENGTDIDVAQYRLADVNVSGGGGGGGMPFLTATIINNTDYDLSNVTTCAPKAEYGVDFNQIPVPATSTEIKEYLYEFMGNDSYVVRLYFEGVGVSQVTISYSNLVNCTLNQADGWLDITDPSENASATLTLTKES